MTHNKFQKGQKVQFKYKNSCRQTVNAYGLIDRPCGRYYYVNMGDGMPLMKVYGNKIKAITPILEPKQHNHIDDNSIKPHKTEKKIKRIEERPERINFYAEKLEKIYGLTRTILCGQILILVFLYCLLSK